MTTFLKMGRTYRNAEFVRKVTVDESGDVAHVSYDGEGITPVIGKENVDELVEQLERLQPLKFETLTLEERTGEPIGSGAADVPPPAVETPTGPSFESIGIAAKPAKLLRQAGIATVDELVQFAGANDLEVIDGIGPSTAEEIRRALGDKLPTSADADKSGDETKGDQ